MRLHLPRVRRYRRTAVLLSVTALLAGALIAPAAATADDTSTARPRLDKISDIVLSNFKDHATQEFWVKLNVRADNSVARQIDNWDTRGTRVAATLRSVADDSQASVRALLDADNTAYDAYWITNTIRVREGDRDLVMALSALPVVESILPKIRVVQDEPFQGEPQPKVGAVEWGIADINADDVWADYGVTGEGIVVATIDTGVQYNHPALIEQYRGNLGGGDFDNNYNWFDVFGASDFPVDGDIHGTHTMGTIVGDDGGANQIGVAPGAKWIASNAISQGDFGLFLEAMEWMLEPLDLEGENPDASKRPNIISNSWGVAGVPTDPFGDDIQQAWIDSGIFGTWSNRNLGPDCDSTGSPGGRALSYSNGAYDINHVIADFSSRGPGQDGMVKPNISGPGVDVRSSIPGGGYTELSGTSMSTPHLAGAVALLWSAAPALIGDIEGTREILDSVRRRQAGPHLRRHAGGQQRVRRGPARRPGRHGQRADRRHRDRRGHRHGGGLRGAHRRRHRRVRQRRRDPRDQDRRGRHVLHDAGHRLVRRLRDGVRVRGRLRDGRDRGWRGDHVRRRARAGGVLEVDRAGARPGDRRAASRRDGVDRWHAAVDRHEPQRRLPLPERADRHLPDHRDRRRAATCPGRRKR